VISKRAYSEHQSASSWEEIWEAGPYYERISEVLEKAKNYAFFVGWQIDSRLRLGSETLKQKVLRICETKPNFHFYFLVWDHAYFYILEREAWQGRIWDEIHPHVHFVFDSRHSFGGSHHEKVCVIDGQIAFCGGIDLCDDRWDTAEHLYSDKRRSLTLLKEEHGPYHDVAVQVSGPVVQAIESHIESRWRLLSSIPTPEKNKTRPPFAQDHSVYLSRTLSQVDPSPTALVREVEFLFRDLIQSAQKNIVLEGQYYWSREVNALLIKKMRERAGSGFKIVMILAEMSRFKTLVKLMSAHEASLLAELMDVARSTGTDLIAGYPYATRAGFKPKPIYVHSKVLVIDDRYLSIGSANFAARALRLDTEVNLTLEARSPFEKAHIKRVSRQILNHWGIEPPDKKNIYLKPITATDDLQLMPRLLRKIPFRFFFDPPLPWLFSIKIKMVRSMRRKESARVAFNFAYWLTGYATTLLLIRFMTSALALTPSRNNPWLLLESALIYSAWALPVPIVLGSLFVTLSQGLHFGSQIVVASLWVSSVWTYILARTFPSYSSNFYGRIYEKFSGTRDFAALTRFILDPRVSFQNKNAYQGLFCIPLPWFLLTSGLVIPGAIYLICHLAQAETPFFLVENIRMNPDIGFAILLGLTVSIHIGRLWKKNE